MELEYIILYINSDNGKQIEKKIALNLKILDYWTEDRLMKNLIDPAKISHVVVGPRTVFQMFESPNFTGNQFKVTNINRDKTMIYRFTDPLDKQLWRSTMKSFIVWTYDYWKSINCIRYCESDNQCGKNEMCLCKNGQSHPSWCPVSKRRCKHAWHFVHESPIPIKRLDQMNIACVEKELHKAKVGDSTELSRSLLIDLARRCAKDKLDIIEGPALAGMAQCIEEEQMKQPNQENMIEGFVGGEINKWLITFVLLVIIIYIYLTRQ